MIQCSIEGVKQLQNTLEMKTSFVSGESIATENEKLNEVHVDPALESDSKVYRTVPSVILASDERLLEMVFSWYTGEEIVLEILHQANDLSTIE